MKDGSLVEAYSW